MPTAVQAATEAAVLPDTAPGTSGVGDGVQQGRIRRVASAPAFKHASCYHEVSPTAAVAAAAVEAAVTPSSSISKQRHQAGTQRPAPACSSCTGGRCSCLEVYVVSRAFAEFAGPVMKRLHPDAREHLVDIGICHYMTVFKTPDGQLVQFDFGPLGGDVQKAHGPLATFLRRARAAAQQHQQQQASAAVATAAAAAAAAAASSSSTSSSAGSSGSLAIEQPSSSSGSRGLVHSPSAPSLPMASLDLATYGGGDAAATLMQAGSADRPRRGVMGEIRELQLSALPSACMYMGRTSLTLDDIRRYNAVQGRRTYTLHENDCRHYVNSLVQYTTGVERSTQHLKRHYFHSRFADKWLWYGWFISAAQMLTDVGNWSHIQAGAAVTLLAVTGRSTLASLKTLATPVLPALKSLPALLPTAGLTAAAAGAAGAAGAAAPGTAAAVTAGSGGTVIGSIAATLKLPATLLVKRPLTAGAAAGSAGAAAVALRDSSPAAAEAVAATTAGSSSSTDGSIAGRPSSRAWGAFVRPLQSVGDGVSYGLRSAVLGVRRLSLGHAAALQQLQVQPLAIPADAALAGVGAGAGAAGGVRPGAFRGFWAPRGNAAGEGVPPVRRGWFGLRARSSSGSVAGVGSAGVGVAADNEQVVQLAGQAADSSGSTAAVAPAAAVAAGDGGWGPEEQQGQQQQARRRPLLQLGQGVGRQVLWLGCAAARASGQLAQLAFGGAGRPGGGLPGGVVAQAPAVMAGVGGPRPLLVHSSSSGTLQQQQQPVLLPPGVALAPASRSMSLPTLLVANGGGPAAAATAAPVAPYTVGSSTVGSSSSNSGSSSSSSNGALLSSPHQGPPESLSPDLTFWWDTGSSSITSSSVGSSKSPGVGRQVLSLPPPRISWGKRATQAMIVRQ